MTRHPGAVPSYLTGADTDPIFGSAAGGRERPRRHLPSWSPADRRPWSQDG